jgi:hypothetical protein
LLFLPDDILRTPKSINMWRRQFFPIITMALAAYFSGGSATRLHVSAVLFTKLIVVVAFVTLLVFVVRRSANLRHPLPFSSLPWLLLDLSLLIRHLPCGIDLNFVAPEAPCLSSRFQRPPPAFAR